MTFTRLDDGIFEHPKMLRAGEDAAALYVRALVYCNRYLTDGHIPLEALSVITRRRDARALVARLVDANLLEVHWQSGWIVHDFHDFNPRSEDVKARRSELSAKRAEAGKRGGIRSGESRREEANAKQTRSKTEANDEANVKPQSQSQSQSKETQREQSNSSEQPNGSVASATLSLLPDEEAPKAPRDIDRVFAHWQTATNHTRAVLDAKRERAIRSALKSYSVADICRSIDGYARSPFHQGQNNTGARHDDITLIVRDATHVEAGWSLATKHAPAPRPAPPPPAPRPATAPRVTAEEVRAMRAALAPVAPKEVSQ